MITPEEFLKEKYKHLNHVKNIKSYIVDFEFKDLCDLFEQYANQSKWIDDTISIPEKDGYYLCRLFVSGGTWMEVCEFEKGQWYYDGSNKTIEEEINEYITHWQQLPENP